MKTPYIFILLLILAEFNSGAQQEPASETEFHEEQYIEDVVSRSDDEVGFNEILENTEFLKKNPLNLNAATREELEKLNLLNDFQIFSLLDYRKNFGNLASLNELQFIPGFSEEMILNLGDLVVVRPPPQELPTLRQALADGNSQLYTRFQRVFPLQEGYKDSTGYLGGPFKIYTRYAYTFQHLIRAGFTTEKDAGESFPSGKGINIMDFQSAFVQINNISNLKTLIVGDYNLRFGQGLVLWSGFSGGKGADVLNIRKRADGIGAFTSSEENRFFRGAAATVKLNEAEASFFFSMKHVDANISRFDSLHDQVETFSSFRTDGLHTSAYDLRDKDAVGEMIAGGHLTINKSWFRLGATLVHTRFEGALSPFRQGYSLFSPYGNSFTNGGIDFQGRFRNLLFFGEGGWFSGGGMAITSGLLIKADASFTMAFALRSFQQNYTSFYGNPLSEGGKPSNEQGLYSAFQLVLPARFTLNAYYDIFRFPWLKYKIDGPSQGDENFLQLSWDPSRRLKMTARWRRATKQGEGTIPEAGLHPLQVSRRHQVRYIALVQVNEQLRFQQRIDMSFRNSDSIPREKGILLSQDITWIPLFAPFKAAFRYAVFDAGSYDNRIYTYEQDLLYAFSIPAFYGRGTRIYGMVSTTVFKRIEIWFKLARTMYADRKQISSGPAMITGNRRIDAGLQIRLKF